MMQLTPHPNPLPAEPGRGDKKREQHTQPANAPVAVSVVASSDSRRYDPTGQTELDTSRFTVFNFTVLNLGPCEVDCNDDV